MKISETNRAIRTEITKNKQTASKDLSVAEEYLNRKIENFKDKFEKYSFDRDVEIKDIQKTLETRVSE